MIPPLPVPGDFVFSGESINLEGWEHTSTAFVQFHVGTFFVPFDDDRGINYHPILIHELDVDPTPAGWPLEGNEWSRPSP